MTKLSSFDTIVNRTSDRTSKYPLQTIPIFKTHAREVRGCGYRNKSPAVDRLFE
ncbi:hypothetical protein IQ270_17885 [Microcoleus sp. LEGE 07076]|uniref:hypothetical protein n=1 Tax=Microcoleus sp. LEGE 07076 TaxID=915322 RepID=UPI0018816F9C|nr:hypothetical protein [Microcoleus sp. LEGE 07076]MBE9186503.1 hypothetical protein [Microcoleus sp. LEGE 07076]